jgi:uncharacterized protein YegJ (DUF2314 family)
MGKTDNQRVAASPKTGYARNFFYRPFLLIASALLFPAFFSCEKLALHFPRQPKHGAANNAGANSGITAETLHFDRDDEGLAAIALNARETLPVFFHHLLHPAKGEDNFQLKYPFKADPDSGFAMEQLWLSDIQFKDGVYYGSLANNPFYTTTMKKGDTVAFYTGDITDWMYTFNGKIIGGRSIKYLLEQIPKHEQSDAQRTILGLFE